MSCYHTSSSGSTRVSTGGGTTVLPGKGGSLALGNLHAVLGKEGLRGRELKSGQEYINVPLCWRQHLAMMSTENLRGRTSCLGACDWSNPLIKTVLCTMTLTSTEGTNPQTNAVYSVLGWRGPFLYNSGKSFRLLSSAPSTKVVG